MLQEDYNNEVVANTVSESCTTELLWSKIYLSYSKIIFVKHIVKIVYLTIVNQKSIMETLQQKKSQK